MNPQNKAINKISAQAEKLLASMSELALFTPPTTEGEILNSIIESSKNRIEGAVENAKVAFQYYNKHTSNISPNKNKI